MQKKNAVNAPQIVESQNTSNHPARATSRAREAVPAVYRAILRRLIDANDEERREHWEMCRDFERDKQPVPKDRAQEGLMLNRRRFLLEALEGCRPDKLHHLLIVLHAPLTEVEDALLEFLSAVWGDDNAR